jgi:hypothetical protein
LAQRYVWKHRRSGGQHPLFPNPTSRLSTSPSYHITTTTTTLLSAALHDITENTSELCFRHPHIFPLFTTNLALTWVGFGTTPYDRQGGVSFGTAGIEYRSVRSMNESDRASEQADAGTIIRMRAALWLEWNAGTGILRLACPLPVQVVGWRRRRLSGCRPIKPVAEGTPRSWDACRDFSS